jgi:hypothetical protein|tara:strand:+ start:201 stop:776 length:576 start_codon:yes stop_codon:yes gene_type:complete
MKKFVKKYKSEFIAGFILWVLLAFCNNSYAQSNTVSSTSSTVSGTTTVDRTPSTASAPSVVINNQDVCSFAASGAIQTQIFGLAGGTAIRDMNCERMKLSTRLFRMGMKVGAVAMLCQDARVFQAMEMAGTPCPYMGKIGIEAATAWAENPDRRPDYEQWKKDNVVDKEIITDEEAAGLGIGGLLFLLLLL